LNTAAGLPQQNLIGGFTMGTKAKQHTRKARVSKQTEHPITVDEQLTAIRELVSGGQLNAVRKAHFCETDRNLPIAGTGHPKPCPFCGHTDVSVLIQTCEKDGSTFVHVQCEHCGCDAPGASSTTDRKDQSTYALVLEACIRWNERGAS
jgi:predicted RNA-binding Zn-ribbon protein involved in translation (DUF1610 family)